MTRINTKFRAHFGEFIKAHDVASKQKADETILGVTEMAPTTFVINNDKFAKFIDKEPLSNSD